ncbi:alpha/beta hydrolase [Williamsia deligens]|uniref:Alpha/beta hydrolase n=1 Tax=Williamsia deligens TaxID=321325 RepID=A0ABW3G7V7_9NOCA|nr:alpha/beta fold hydrolase [Williamsia deligens]
MTSPTPGPHPPVLHRIRHVAAPSMVVLVLHGGRVRSTEPAQTGHLSAARMRPFARAIARRMPDATVLMLQYRFRGWNGADRSPVADARWALDRIRDRYGDVPVVLVGHSMGGRTAAAVADDPSVDTIVALAPWWPEGTEADTLRPGQHLQVLHGRLDRWTSPRLSLLATQRAAERGVDARWLSMGMAGHFMLMRPWVWTRRVVAAVGAAAARIADAHPIDDHPIRQENLR